MRRLKQGVCLLLSAAMLTAGAPAVLAAPDEAVESVLDSIAEAAETAKFQYQVNETFDGALTDEATQIIPTVKNWGGTGSAVVEQGRLQLKHVEKTKDFQLEVPIVNGTVDNSFANPAPRGKTFVSWDLGIGEKMEIGTFTLCGQGKKTNKIVFKVNQNGAVITYWDESSTEQALETVTEKIRSVRVGIDSSVEGNSTLIGIWVTTEDGTEKEISAAENVVINDVGGGLNKIIFYPSRLTAGQEFTPGDVVCFMDNLKVWESAQTQIEELAKLGTEIAFDSIKGRNESADQITEDLNLSAGVTPGGLKVLSWESSNPEVISAEGKVTGAAEDVQVTLTPTLMLEEDAGETTEGYVTVPGDALTVTVKAKEGEPEKPAAPTGAFVDENFDTIPETSQAATRPIPWGHGWSGATGTLKAVDGWMSFVHGTGASKNLQLDMPVMNGVLAGAPGHTAENAANALPAGETCIEFSFRQGATATQSQVYVAGSSNLMKIIFYNSGNINFTYDNGSGALGNTMNLGKPADIKKGCTVKMQFSSGADGLNLVQLWIDGVEKLESPLTLNNIDGGITKLCFCPTADTLPEGTETLALDWYKVYGSGQSQVEILAKEEGAKLTFDDIKGANTNQNAVETDLDFTSKTMTDNGLKVMEWKSSDPSVISENGKVTRPEENAVKVTLTPVLGLKDEASGGYFTADGQPITVIVASTSGGAIDQDNLFTYLLKDSFDQANRDPKTLPMPWNNSWDTENLAEAVVKNGAVEINQTKGTCVSGPFQMEIPLTFGYANGKGGSPLCGTVPRGDQFVEFSWTVGAKTTEITFYLCGRNSTDNNAVSWVLRKSENSNQWSVDVRRRDSNKTWKVITTVENLNLSSGENTIRAQVDSSQSGLTVLKNVWINGQRVSMAEENTLDVSNGLFKLMILPKGSQEAGDDILKLTEMKVWENFSVQLKKLLENDPLAFDSIKGENTDQHSVTTDLVFDSNQTSAGGFKVFGWKSSREELIATDGSVVQPSYADGDQQVILTPVFEAKDPENVDGTGKVKGDGAPITVTVKAMNPAETLDYVKRILSFEDIKGENSGADAVTTDLNLISQKHGVNLAWELISIVPSGTSATLNPETGAVFRPELTQGDVTMTVKAKLSCEGVSGESNPISFTVKKIDIPTTEYLNNIGKELTFAEFCGANESESKIRTNLELPSEFWGVKVSWSCSGSEIASDGTVNRPGVEQEAASVTLTAKLQYGTASVEKSFRLTVLPEDTENLVKPGKISGNIDASAEELNALLDEKADTAVSVRAALKKFNLVFDLGEKKPVSQVYFTEKNAEDGKWAILEYTIEVSDNGSEWKTIYTGKTDRAQSVVDFDPVLAQYVRLNVTKKESGRTCELAETGVRYQPESAKRVKADAESLTIDVPKRITENSITLPEKGIFGSVIRWSFMPGDLISKSYVVTHPKQDTGVVLVAEIISGDSKEIKKFQRTIAGTSSGSTSRPSGGGSGGSGGSGGGGGGTTPRLPEPEPSAKPNTEPEVFRDLAQADWAREYILGLYAQGVVNGKEDGLFMPMDNVTREEYVKMLALIFELEPDFIDAFRDVENGAWYAPYIGGAYTAGIVNGVEDGVFGVGQTITRQDMAVMTYRAAKAAGLELNEKTAEKTFGDANAIAEYAAEAISVLQKAGLFSGDENGAFRPEENSTRAEAAKILYLLAAERNTGIGGY